MAAIVQLHPTDNVCVVIYPLLAGDVLSVDGKTINVLQHVAFGHKIAVSAINPGQKIIKYGAGIGSATHPITAGEHVHTHNMQSDYILMHRTVDSEHEKTRQEL